MIIHHLVVHHVYKSHSTFENHNDLIEQQYNGKEDLKKLYDLLMKEVKGFGPAVHLSPEKAYTSLRRKKQFALVRPSAKTRLAVGPILKTLCHQGHWKLVAPPH